MTLRILSVSQNEAFARATVGAFISQINPTMDELTEVKTVVSEAVTNAIIHGYESKPNYYINIYCILLDNSSFEIQIHDEGVGIDNIQQAQEPLYTSKPHLERSGMGFTIMESFMDGLEIQSTINEGTTVIMKKQLTTDKSVCH